MLIEDQVGELLAAAAGVDPSCLRVDALLDQDLGLDSLGLTEVLLALEDDLSISIPDPIQAGLCTFGDLVAVVASEVAGSRAGTLRSAPG